MGSYHIQEILIIDDDLIVRMLVKKILKALDFQKPIHEFENGLQGINFINEKLSEQPVGESSFPSLVFLDINMSEMDAWGFLDEFKELPAEHKSNFFISIITSSIDPTDENRAFSYSEVKDYIQKPISANDLIAFFKKHGIFSEEA